MKNDVTYFVARHIKEKNNEQTNDCKCSLPQGWLWKIHCDTDTGVGFREE